MKDKYAALAKCLMETLNDKYEIEAYFNEIRVIISDEDDKVEKLKELSCLLDEVNAGKYKGYRLKVMYFDEYPDGFSPERAIIKYLSERFPNTLILGRTKYSVVVTMNIPEADEKTDYILSLVNESYHIHRQIYINVPHRGRAVNISLRFGLARFDFTINKDNSIEMYGYPKLDSLSARIIFYIIYLPKGKFNKVESSYFTTNNSEFVETLQELVKLRYIEVENLSTSNTEFKIKLLKV
jgi:hypothetical protein